MNTAPKKGIVLGLVVCVLVAFGILMYVKSQDKNESQTQNTEQQGAASNTASNTQNTPSSEKPADKPSDVKQSEQVVSTTPNKASLDGKELTYEQVLGIYRNNGTRIQISNCSGNPGKMNTSTGTKIMIDNRDREAHTFKLDTQTYRVAAYGWAIATAPKYGNYFLTCDNKGASELQVYP